MGLTEYPVMVTVLPGHCLFGPDRFSPMTHGVLSECLEIFGEELHEGITDQGNGVQYVKFHDNEKGVWVQVPYDHVVTVCYKFDGFEMSVENFHTIEIMDVPFNLRRYVKQVGVLRHAAEVT